jgi:hypothetical protein
VKAIFLDIDGVLNTMYTEGRVTGSKLIIGIEDRFVELLKQIVDATDAVIVLTSTWKLFLNDRDDPQGK